MIGNPVYFIWGIPVTDEYSQYSTILPDREAIQLKGQSIQSRNDHVQDRDTENDPADHKFIPITGLSSVTINLGRKIHRISTK